MKLLTLDPAIVLPPLRLQIILQSLKIEAMWCSNRTITGSLGQVTKKKRTQKRKNGYY